MSEYRVVTIHNDSNLSGLVLKTLVDNVLAAP